MRGDGRLRACPSCGAIRHRAPIPRWVLTDLARFSHHFRDPREERAPRSPTTPAAESEGRPRALRTAPLPEKLSIARASFGSQWQMLLKAVCRGRRRAPPAASRRLKWCWCASPMAARFCHARRSDPVARDHANGQPVRLVSGLPSHRRSPRRPRLEAAAGRSAPGVETSRGAARGAALAPHRASPLARLPRPADPPPSVIRRRV